MHWFDTINVPKSFQSTDVIETGSSFDDITVMKKSFKKLQPSIVNYKSHKKFKVKLLRGVFCVCVKRIMLCNCLCSSSCFSASRVWNFGVVNRYSWFWNSVNMVNWGGEFSFFQGIHVKTYKNWYLHIHKTYGYQIRQVGTSSRAVSRIWMQLPFFANALFWAPGNNLGLKRPANSCNRVAFATGVQGKPKHCRALKVAKGPEMFSCGISVKYKCHVDTSHSTIVMVTYFSCNGSLTFFAKYLSVTRFFSCSQLWESSQQPQLWYHFVLKVNFEKEFLPPKFFPFRGPLAQRFWYPFKPF